MEWRAVFVPRWNESFLPLAHNGDDDDLHELTDEAMQRALAQRDNGPMAPPDVQQLVRPNDQLTPSELELTPFELELTPSEL
eukprot:418314-Pyramimonas_sp.AAC.1